MVFGRRSQPRAIIAAWTARFFLRPGRYTYKFLVNRKSKIVDPSGATTEPDGFGGLNSVLVVP